MVGYMQKIEMQENYVHKETEKDCCARSARHYASGWWSVISNARHRVAWAAMRVQAVL